MTLDEYKKLVKVKECRWCGESLEDEPIEGYTHGHGGWTVDGEHVKKWLYIECPKCGYEWALSKLGVPREKEE